MKVLIGYSCCPLTRAAFEKHGHEVWTCDLLPARGSQKNHLQGDVWKYLDQPWDLAILHPMCTYLTVSAAWAFKDPDYDKYPETGYHQRVKAGTLTGAERRQAREEALQNFRDLLALPFPKAIENPGRSFISKAIRPADQIIKNSWQAGAERAGYGEKRHRQRQSRSRNDRKVGQSNRYWPEQIDSWRRSMAEEIRDISRYCSGYGRSMGCRAAGADPENFPMSEKLKRRFVAWWPYATVLLLAAFHTHQPSFAFLILAVIHFALLRSHSDAKVDALLDRIVARSLYAQLDKVDFLEQASGLPDNMTITSAMPYERRNKRYLITVERNARIAAGKDDAGLR